MVRAQKKRGHWPKVNAGEHARGDNPFAWRMFKIRCSVVNSDTLEPKQIVLNHDYHKEQNKNSDFLKQNTFQIGRSGGSTLQVSCKLLYLSIHLVWSWFLTCLTSAINILTVGFHYTCKFYILIDSKFLTGDSGRI